MFSSFQTKIFVAALASAAIALVVAGVLIAASTARRTDARIEQTLTAETRLAGDLLARGTPSSDGAELDAEADRIGELVGARVTFIAADGRVIGDSAEALDALASMENHASRPEVVEARLNGLGKFRRHSDTLNIDMLYVAVPVNHPAIAFVRVALPLTDIRQQFRAMVAAIVVALGLALIGAAVISWAFSSRRSARQAIAGVARRYGGGDRHPRGSTTATTSLAWSHARRRPVVGRQLAEQARDRARMKEPSSPG